MAPASLWLEALHLEVFPGVCFFIFPVQRMLVCRILGARLRGRTTTHASEKGSGEGFSEGFLKGGLLWVLQ